MKATKSMKRSFLAVGCTGLTLCGGLAQAAITLNFANDAGSTMVFNQSTPSSFSFTSVGGGSPSQNNWQWYITSVGGGAGTSLGDVGWFASPAGPWTFGPIATSGDVQSAPIDPSVGATISIFDGSATWTGTVTWGTIATVGYAGSVQNDNVTVNVNNIQYVGGADPDLVGMGSAASLTISFQF